MAGQNITTSIDALMKYLGEHGETESGELAKALNVNESIIETWADVLEKAKITKITYKVGKMYVSLATSGKVAETAKATAEFKKGIAETEMQAQVVAINQVSAKIDQFKQYVTGAEAAFKNKAGETKSTLDEIDKLDAQIGGAHKRLKEKKDYVDGLVGKLTESVQTLEQKSAELAAVSSGGDAKALIEDIHAKLEGAESMIAGLGKEYDRAAGESRKSFTELVDGMKSESESLRRLLFQHEKEWEEYDAMAKRYGRDLEKTRRQVAGDRARMLDDIAKTSAEVGRVYAATDGRIDALRKSLAGMKKDFGGLAELSDKIAKAKADIAGTEKQRDAIAKDLGDLTIQLRALSTMDMTGKSREAEDINRKVSASGKKIGSLNSNMDGLKEEVDDIGR